MDSASLIEDFETGLFEGEGGRRFIKCEFDPDGPVWIDISNNLWGCVYSGLEHSLDWDAVQLPLFMRNVLKNLIANRLKKNSPFYLSKLRIFFRNLTNFAFTHEITFLNGFEGVSASQLLILWNGLNASDRSLLRSIYSELADSKLCGADFFVAKEMSDWKSRKGTSTLREVRDWDSELGSFTTLEWELIRRELVTIPLDESDSDCASRIFGRIVNETLKRPKQVLSIKKDALFVTPSGKQTFLKIPGAKGQIASGLKFWPITNDLAQDILAYCSRQQISNFQSQIDRLIVMPASRTNKPAFIKYGQVDVATAKSKLQNWVKKVGAISPRTNEIFNLTPYRIRHTGATAMALQGVPRDQIQEILEHDSPESADAYIEAVGSDLLPALERTTDRGVGKVFSELKEAYFFKGRISDKNNKKPIYIPIVDELSNQPAVVGSCGSNEACTKHPFWACYNGCPHFFAWRDAPHEKSLEFVEAELKRWSIAEGGKSRSKLSKDFDRVGAGIREVIKGIEGLDHES